MDVVLSNLILEFDLDNGESAGSMVGEDSPDLEPLDVVWEAEREPSLISCWSSQDTTEETAEEDIASGVKDTRDDDTLLPLFKLLPLPLAASVLSRISWGLGFIAEK